MPAQHQHISIGALTLGLRCERAALAAALRQRYGAFLGGGDVAPQLVVSVALGAPQPMPEAVELAGARARVAGPGMVGQIDLAQGQATLCAAPGFALGAVEQLLRVACAMLAFEAGGLLVHGAAIASGPRGHLFLGPSGAGKTTVARNSPGRRVLNDDLALLWPAQDGWKIVATPFSNPTQVAPSGPGQAPLAALHHLVQAHQVARTPMGAAVAVAALAARVPLVGADPARGAALLRRAGAICAIVPSYYLHFLPDPSFWHTVEPAP